MEGGEKVGGVREEVTILCNSHLHAQYLGLSCFFVKGENPKKNFYQLYIHSHSFTSTSNIVVIITY